MDSIAGLQPSCSGIILHAQPAPTRLRLPLRLSALAALTTLVLPASAQPSVDAAFVASATASLTEVAPARLELVAPAATPSLDVRSAPVVPVPSGNRFMRWMGTDARALASDVAPRMPSIVLGSAALLGAGMQVDMPMLQGIQAHYTGRMAPVLDAVNELGGPHAFPLAGAAFGASLFTRNQKLQDATFTSFQSLVYAGAVSYGIKAMAGRVRPEDVANAKMMRPFSGNTSFPSGHTTQAFAIVTPWAYYYPGPITYGLVAVAGGTAIARVARNKHWPTDIAAGAALGFATGRYLARRHLNQQGRVETPRLRVDPIATTQEIGASMTLRLD